MDTKNIQRRYDLDWLRVLGILAVFLFHSTRFFDFGDWHVKNPFTYVPAVALQSFMTIWMMPLMFLVSGASIYYAMDKGGAGKFLKDKVLRLLVPLLVAMFSYGALQVYLERVTHGQFNGSFWAFIPHYFEGMYGFGGNFAWIGMHMWYVLVLFVYCLLFYPLFRWWKGSAALAKIGDILAFPWTRWLALAVPIVVLAIFISDTAWEAGAGGWGFLYYSFFLFYGFVIVASERLQANIQRTRWTYLVVGLILAAAYTFLAVNVDNPAIEPLEDAYGDLLYVLSACTLLPAILGFGMQHLTKNTPFLKYAGEAVMGFYILHQTVLLVVGYFVLQWDLSGLAKWAIIAVTSFGLIMAIYEFLIRRVNVLRFLCGMKTITKSKAVAASENVLAEAKSH
ncbi:MAG: acyltransferase [Chloroflexota bacterium]